MPIVLDRACPRRAIRRRILRATLTATPCRRGIPGRAARHRNRRPTDLLGAGSWRTSLSVDVDLSFGSFRVRTLMTPARFASAG